MRMNLSRLSNLYFLSAITFVGIILGLPLLFLGYPLRGYDSIGHLAWFWNFYTQFSAGEWYPRWLQGMNGGLGSPAFYFYGPIPYWIASLFEPLFQGDAYGVRGLGLSLGLALIASGLAFYFLMRQHCRDHSAFFGAIVYMIAPFHIGQYIYISAGFTQSWAFVWMPIVMLAAHYVVREKRFAVPALAIAVTTLIMTHLLAFMLLSVMLIAYALFFGKPKRKRLVTLRVIFGIVLGMLLASTYLLPVFTMREYIYAETFQSGPFYFANRFLFVGRYSLDHYLTIMSLEAIALAIFAALFLWINRASRGAIYWVLVSFCAFFMMLSVSEYIWQVLTPLQSLQSPIRFNVLLTFSVSALVVYVVDVLRWKDWQSLRAVLLIGIISILGKWAYDGLKAEYYTAWQFQNTDMQKVREAVSIGKEYSHFFPRTVDQRFRNEAGLRALIENDASVHLVEGEGYASLLDQGLGRFTVMVKVISKQARVVVPHFHFPTWKAQLDDQSTELPVSAFAETGLLSAELPHGEHRVIFYIDTPFAIRIGWWLSVITGILLLMMFVRESEFHSMKRNRGKMRDPAH